MNKTCKYCGKTLKNRRNKTSTCSDCYQKHKPYFPPSPAGLLRLSLRMRGEKNINWSNSKNYDAIHDYVKMRKPKPALCEICKERPPFDLAFKNHNGKRKEETEYTRNPDDYQWLCHKCHMLKDGNTGKLHRNDGSDHFFLGKHHTEEAKERMRLAHKGKHFSPATEFKKGHKLFKGAGHGHGVKFRDDRNEKRKGREVYKMRQAGRCVLSCMRPRHTC